MAPKQNTPLALRRDPFALMHQIAGEFDRLVGGSAWPTFEWPTFGAPLVPADKTWFPQIDVFEKDGRLVTKIDLPGMKKEDVKVEITDGQLAIFGERKSEAKEEKENFYRCERNYGSFSRLVPLPEGVKLEDVAATFADGVLEVTIPLPAKPKAAARQVPIDEAPKAVKTAA